MTRKGTRDGDNGDKYSRKTITSQNVKHWGVSSGATTIIIYIVAQLMGIQLPGQQPSTPENIGVATEQRMYTNKSDIEKLSAAFDKHVALQVQWEKNTIEKINQNQEYIKEQLKDIKERLK